jgi:hypothetical protein
MKRKQPIVARSRLENLAWKITPRDYRTKWRGERAVLVHGTHGTTLNGVQRGRADSVLGQALRPLGAMRGKTMDDKHRRNPTRVWALALGGTP